jgi:hypothetical protein
MSEMITMPQLRERGWTPVMVRDLLGEPDEQRRNPVYRSAAPMRLYAAERVAAAEADPRFAERKAISAKRSAVSAAVADRKRDELLAQAAAVRAQVPRMTRERLIREACDSYNAHRAARGDASMAMPGSDPEFLERISVNYLRHELTGYESELAALFGKTGRSEASAVIRECVYDAIADAYPELAAECTRQLARRDLAL